MKAKAPVTSAALRLQKLEEMLRIEAELTDCMRRCKTLRRELEVKLKEYAGVLKQTGARVKGSGKKRA